MENKTSNTIATNNINNAIVDISEIDELYMFLNKYTLPIHLQQKIIDNLPGFLCNKINENGYARCIKSKFDWIVLHNNNLLSIEISVDVTCGHIPGIDYNSEFNKCDICNYKRTYYGDGHYQLSTFNYEYLRSEEYSSCIGNINVKLYDKLIKSNIYYEKLWCENELLQTMKRVDILQKTLSIYIPEDKWKLLENVDNIVDDTNNK